MPGRNDPCPCGSGKKFKKCCLKSVVEFDLYDSWREVEGGLIPKLLRFARENFGEEDLREVAWSAWINKPSIFEFEEEVESQIYLPWYLFTAQRPVKQGGKLENPAKAMQLDRKASYLSGDEKKLLEATNLSPFTFYTVKSIEKGHSFVAYDLLRQEDFDIREKQATQILNTGYLLFGRHVSINGISFMMGMSPHVFEDEKFIEVMKLRRELLKFHGVDHLRLSELNGSQDRIISLYLEIRDQVINSPPGRLTNTDGDDFLPQKLHFQSKEDISTVFYKLFDLATGANKRRLLEGLEVDAQGKIVRACLPWLRRGNAKYKTWHNTVLGNIEIMPRKIVIEVNSNNRAECIRQEVERRLGETISYQTKLIEPVDHILKEKNFKKNLALDTQLRNINIDNESKRKLEKRNMDMHWREWLVSPLECLEFRTPEEAVKDDEGRELLEALLVSMEVKSRHDPSAQGPDISSLRESLGLSRQKKASSVEPHDVKCGRAVSEVFLEYIEPILEELGDDIGDMKSREINEFLKLPVLTWNFSTKVSGKTNDDSFIKREYQNLLAHFSEDEKEYLNFLIERKKYGFSQYKYLIRDVKFRKQRDGQIICKAEAIMEVV